MKTETTIRHLELHPDNATIVVWEHGSAGCIGKDAKEVAELIVRAVKFYLDHHDD